MHAAARWVIGAALALLPGLAQAQHWVTREVCDFDTPRIHTDLIGAEALAGMRARAAAAPNGTGRFWQVTSPGGAVSHLFGTLHGAHPDILDLPEEVVTAIRQARVLSPEIDYTAPTRQHINARLNRTQMWASARGGSGFDDLDLPDEIAGRIRSRFAGIGWGREAPDHLTPGAVAEVLLGDPCEDFTAGVVPMLDSYIHTLAHIARVPVRGLEHPDSFLSEMNKAARRDTVLAIIAVYGAYLSPTGDARGRATYTAMYLRGELALISELDRAFLQSVYGGNLGASYQATVDAYLIDERNRAFLEAARTDLDQGGLFMAIGAGHLAGEGGMIALMRAAGFTVTRLPLPGEVHP